MGEIKRSKTRVSGFVDEEMDFQLFRQLGSCAYGGSAVGECLALAAKIDDGNPSSWVDQFSALAKRQKADADLRAEKGHSISARDQYLRACNAFRAGEYYTDCQDARHRELGRQAWACFHKAMKYAWHTFEEIMLPYKEIKLPVYFMAPERGDEKRKTLLIVSGFDGTREEEYLQRGYAALERGYNVVLFAGPGQMDLFRFYSDTHFEPDFENPVTAVVDYCMERPEVDVTRMALMGISFGGYFATRATAYGPRLEALVANSPILDLHAYMSAFIGFDPAEMPDDQNFRLEDLPDIPEDVMSRQQKVMSANLMRRFGQPSMKETFIYLKTFRVGSAVADIKCPALALVGEGEGGEPEKQFNAFRHQVAGPVTSHRFTADEGADAHCQVGNLSFSAAVCLDWLDEIFDLD